MDLMVSELLGRRRLENEAMTTVSSFRNAKLRCLMEHLRVPGPVLGLKPNVPDRRFCSGFLCVEMCTQTFPHGTSLDREEMGAIRGPWDVPTTDSDRGEVRSP